jgi:phosphotransferase system IIB component
VPSGAAWTENGVTPDQILAAVGGRGNIQEAKAVAGTRVRLVLKNVQQINHRQLADVSAGSAQVYPGGVVHWVTGLNASEQARFFQA